MALPTRFNADLYTEFRPHYPSDIFSPLTARLLDRKRGPTPQSFANDPPAVLDLGCGTGLSLTPLKSALRDTHPGSRLIGMDRDESMLAKARENDPDLEWKFGTAEALPFGNEEFHAVISGSAYHWFDATSSGAEIERVLKPRGLLLLFEYQFPRAMKNSELNDWIRMKFNRDWKAPGQKPRGSLRELTSKYRSSPRWQEIQTQPPRMIRHIHAAEFYGQVISQSRYLHSEADLTEELIRRQRTELREKIAEFYASAETLEFDFYLSSFLFQKSGPPASM